MFLNWLHTYRSDSVEKMVLSHAVWTLSCVNSSHQEKHASLHHHITYMWKGLKERPFSLLITPDHVFGTWQLWVTHWLIACLPSSTTCLSSAERQQVLWPFLSIYGIKAASNSDVLIRSTQLKLTRRSLTVCTQEGKIGFLNALLRKWQAKQLRWLFLF